MRAAQDLGYPLALKLHSTEITHKTEAGGVVLNIENEDALRGAWETLNREFPADELLLQRMIPPGVELIIGAKRDPAFGPVVAVGLGGVFVEIFKDIALGVCPVTKEQTKRMIGSLKARPILKGYRNQPSVNEENLVRVIQKVSDFMLANLEVMELDINPMIANGEYLIAVDALMRVD